MRLPKCVLLSQCDIVILQIVTSSSDLQDYAYYFVPAPWLSVKLLRLLQNYPPPENPSIRTRLTDCLETILNKAQVHNNLYLRILPLVWPSLICFSTFTIGSSPILLIAESICGRIFCINYMSKFIVFRLIRFFAIGAQYFYKGWESLRDNR